MAESFVDILRQWAITQPERIVYTLLVDGETQECNLTYGELDLRARAIAAELQCRAAPGDRALLFLEGELDFLTAFWGCLYAGVVAVPIAPSVFRQPAMGERLQLIARSAGARLVLTTAELNSSLTMPAGPETLLDRVAIDAVPSGSERSWQPPTITPDTLVLLQYTSGSTTEPRGVMISHGNLLFDMRVVQQTLGYTEAMTTVSWAPLFYVGGLIMVLQALFVGMRGILLPPMAFVANPLCWLRTISRYRAYTSLGPNSAYELCASRATSEQCTGLDLSCWQVAVNAAEPIHATTMEHFEQVFAPYGFQHHSWSPAYGLAEASALVSAKPYTRPPVVTAFSGIDLRNNHYRLAADDDLQVRRLVSCGPVVTGMRAVIVDPKSATCNVPGTIGEIWLAGPGVTQGYWNRPEATEQTFRAFLADTGEGPFLRTGDLGFIDQDELYITGRLKDMIILQGRNHYPQDIEAALLDCHPALRPGGGAAFSITVDNTERLVILHELKTSTLAEADAGPIIQNIRRAVAEREGVPVYTLVLLPPGSLSKTSSGKMQRAAYRAAFLEGRLDGLAAWTAETEASALQPLPEDLEDRLIALWQKFLGRADISPEDNFFALGGDSLMALELTLQIEEQFGMAVPSEFFQQPTVSALVRLMRESLPKPSERHVPAGDIVESVNTDLQQPTGDQTVALAKTPGRLPSTPAQRVPDTVLYRVRRSIENVALRRPYAEGMRWLAGWAGQRWVQKIFYRSEIRLMRQFLQSLGRQEEPDKVLMQQSIVGHWLGVQLRRLLEKATPDEFSQALHAATRPFFRDLDRMFCQEPPSFFTVSGLEYLQDLKQQGRGVILLGYHDAIGFLAFPTLSRLDPSIYVLGRKIYLRTFEMQHPGASQEAFRTQRPAVRAYHAVQAHRILAQGGTVFMASDVEEPDSGIPVTIGDRGWTLPAGAAHLAIATGAAILPIASSFLSDWIVRLTLHPPLPMGESSLSETARAEWIIHRYAAFLEETWRQAPEATGWGTIRRHLKKNGGRPCLMSYPRAAPSL
jgi:acyl-CoA synthetase (AMP-forming)/AMP-acid ligase II/acyl carrier protein/lauroyl/myristoyl acyltransferase